MAHQSRTLALFAGHHKQAHSEWPLAVKSAAARLV
jgi:hypothetical protein